MKSTLKRRDFIRNSTITAMAAMMPAHLLSSPLAPLYGDQLEPGGEFSLLKLKALFPDYGYPYTDKHSTDDFNLKFKLYNCYGGNLRDAGSFEINKEGGVQPVYQVNNIRKASVNIVSSPGKFDYYFTGKIITENNMLATPLSWECETKISTGINEEASMDTSHRWKGSYNHENISYQSGRVNLSKPVENKNLTWKWGIINLVQKMAQESHTELKFSTLDEMDMLYAHQEARLRKIQAIDTGSKTIKFKVFDLRGDGLIPTVYWVDDLHRVVFIITGMEAFVLS